MGIEFTYPRTGTLIKCGIKHEKTNNKIITKITVNFFQDRTLLRKIIEIQDIVLEHKGRGVTQIWVYENIIKDRYHISVATFNNFLATPAKAELKQLLDKRKADERQNPKLF